MTRLLRTLKIFLKTVKLLYLGLFSMAVTLFIMLLFSAISTSCGLAYADNYTKNLVDNKTMEELRAMAERVKVDNESKLIAQKLYEKYLTGEGLKQIEAFMEEKTREWNVYNPSTVVAKSQTPNKEKVIIFISSSIPKETLKSYVKQAGENTSFILRGAVGKDPSKLRPTLEFISDLLCTNPKEEKSCKSVSVTIDPLPFREYQVERVPTILVFKGNDIYKFTGALPVSYIIDRSDERR